MGQQQSAGTAPGKQPTRENLTIDELATRCPSTGMADVAVHGIIIDIKPKSGLVSRCPQCKRVMMQPGQCKVHGAVQGQPDLRIKAVLDDGTGAMLVVIGRELTEKLIGKKLGDLKAAELLFSRDTVSEAIIARPIALTGLVTQDDFGLLMIVHEAQILKPNLVNEAREMLAELAAPKGAAP